MRTLCTRWIWLLCLLTIPVLATAAPSNGSWNGSLHDPSGQPIREATIRLHLTGGGSDYAVQTSSNGHFTFADILPGTYQLSVENQQKTWTMAAAIQIKQGTSLTTALQLSIQQQELRIAPSTAESSPQATGGEHLPAEKCRACR